MSIQGLVNERQAIKAELKTIGVHTSKLRKRVKTIEQEIEEYLEAKDQPGLKYKNIAITREKVDVSKPKKKKDIKEDAIRLFEDYNARSPDRLYERFMEIRKGSPVEKRKLKFKTLKEKK